ICQLPPCTGSKHRSERMIRRNQHSSHVVLSQHPVPPRLDFNDLRIRLEQILAVKVAAAIEKYFGMPVESINKVAAPLVLREDASVGVVLLQIICGANRKHSRVKA